MKCKSSCVTEMCRSIPVKGQLFKVDYPCKGRVVYLCTSPEGSKLLEGIVVYTTIPSYEIGDIRHFAAVEGDYRFAGSIVLTQE